MEEGKCPSHYPTQVLLVKPVGVLHPLRLQAQGGDESTPAVSRGMSVGPRSPVPAS